MDSTLVAVVVAVVATLAVVALGWFAWRRWRSERLRREFGPEYARTVREAGDRRLAEDHLEARRERVSGYDLRALDEGERRTFARRWREVQKRFVDAPRPAIADAHRLVEEVMEARGYPLGDIRRQEEDISVESPEVVRHYRAARAIAVTSDEGHAGTEELRQAMQHYRALFTALLDGGADEERDIEMGTPERREKAS